jgi:hypothetical protein
MAFYEIEFDPVWPVGGILVILAKNSQEAKLKALAHFRSQPYEYMHKASIVESVKEVVPDKNGVIAYKSGEY